jgi:hypothetical protein
MAPYKFDINKYTELTNKDEICSGPTIVYNISQSIKTINFTYGHMIETLLYYKTIFPSIKYHFEYVSIFYTFHYLKTIKKLDNDSKHIINLKDKLKTTWNKIILINQEEIP